MDWWLILSLLLGGTIGLILVGLPVAFAFMLVNVIAAMFLWGGDIGLWAVFRTMRQSVSMFALVPVPLFVLMGEVLFQSGIASKVLEALDKWFGRLPGRLSLLAVGSGTLFATLSGASMASVALMGSVLVPEMVRHGYKKPMVLGPILGSGGLAIMIPPTALGVLLAALMRVSVAKLLIAIILPGLLLAVIYATYVIARCWLWPSLAPAYDVSPLPLSEKLKDTVRYILPLGIIIFLVTGVIFFGMATPTEAAATGSIGTFLLVAAYRRLTWDVIKKSVTGSVQIIVMIFMIIAGAQVFSQVLAFTGATRGLIEFGLSLPLPPIVSIIVMMIILLLMGTFMELFSIMVITIPMFLPVVIALDFEPLWFAVLMLLSLEMATTTPPFGLSLFVMKGVVSSDTSMGDIYKAGVPFLICDAVLMALMLAFPALVLWLPELMG